MQIANISDAYHGRENGFFLLAVVSARDSLLTLRVSLSALRTSLRGVSVGIGANGNLPDLRCSSPAARIEQHLS